MAEYRLKPKAHEDMENVWLYTQRTWGIQQTDKYIDDVVKAFLLLAENPKAGAMCHNIRKGYRKYPVIRHIVYYRETDYGIEIVRVLHDRMLAKNRL